MRFIAALTVVTITGFLSLSYEILWYREFAFTSGGAPWVFGRVLAAFLIGLAQGSIVSRRFVTSSRTSTRAYQFRVVCAAVIASSIAAYLVVPGLAWLATHRLWQAGFVLVAGAAFVMGLVLPLVSDLGIAPNERVGERLSFLYLANVLGSAFGSLLTGFVLSNVWSVETISVVLALAGLAIGVTLSIAALRAASEANGAVAAIRESLLVFSLTLCGAILIAAHHPLFHHVYERLFYKEVAESKPAFAEVVETRGGVVAVTRNLEVYGGGAYDGMIETDMVRDSNLLVRAYALGAMHPRPSRILVVGLGTGAWATALLHLPGVEQLTAVEINAGYLPIIARHAEVRGILTDPRVSIVIDDGRRWLLHHPDERFDAIVMNTTWYWRAHTTNLLSSEFMQIARTHLNPGGIFYFNTTWSPDAMKTGMSAFPYGMRCVNFLALSDSPVAFDSTRWSELLSRLRDERGRLLFGEMNHKPRLDTLLALAPSLHETPRGYGLESRASVLGRVANAHIITDDNMRVEWRATPPY
jgi:spermidine synthase